jgi:LmbE family N-acetylglucosaminyl deacetylase
MERLLVVVAHPDDEVLGVGIHMRRFSKTETHILHCTNGSPRDGLTARELGFSTPAAYAAARRNEVAEALALVDIPGARCHHLDIFDQEAHLHLAELAAAVELWVDRLRPLTVITHAYEGGHPDHDSVAFAVATVKQTKSFSHIEFPLYHANQRGEMVTQELIAPRTDDALLQLSVEEQGLKCQMLSKFVTQWEFLRRFKLTCERLRESTSLDFGRPPHPGKLLYETWGWPLTGAAWRECAAAY